jgi:protein-histidine pros-kinase
LWAILQEARVKLLAKFNLVLIVIFAVGIGLIAHNAYNFLMGEARHEVLQEAEVMSADASATKEYTDQQVSPILEKTPENNDHFLAQTIPFYAANATFQLLRTSRPEYTMREAALNPTNLDDRATEWEAELINYFRNNPGQRERVGDRDTAIGRVLYVAAPIVAEAGCLACHSEAATAPRGLIKHYGSDHGFGWTHNEIIGAQIVSVPMSVPIAMARTGFRDLLIGLSTIFLLTIFLIDLAMYMIVIRPLRRVSKTADSISKGEVTLPPLEVKGRDEIAEVTASFNRMHTSLQKALEMLKG